MTPHADGKMRQPPRAGEWDAAAANYAPLPGIPDEFLGPDGAPKPYWRALFDQLSVNDIERGIGVAERHIRDLGVSYRVSNEARERPWPVSGLPLLIEDRDWSEISAAITQRAALLEALLADVYGPSRLVSDGVLPASVVAGSREFLRPLMGVAPPGGRWLHLYAADIGRGPDGRWWVLNDRAQAPSGVGYALENRLALSRAYPSAYSGMNVRRHAPFFRAFRAGLAARAERAQPRICLMTPGPYSQTYSEQSYLARYLGFLLVEGDDLVVHDRQVHVRTIAGLKRADVLWRRVDADFIDPLELNPASRLGVPRLISAIREGSVVVANMPGSGLVESRAFMSFMPAAARYLLGEALAMPNIATWWCGQPQARERVLDNLDAMSIAGAFAERVPGFDDSPHLVPGELKPADVARLREAIARRGADYVGQEIVRLSTAPVWRKGRLEPRPFVLRVFAAATADGWQVLPGGFCLISDNADARAVSMGEGVRSADVWVMSNSPVLAETLLPSQESISIRRVLGNLPSRAADNLFWYARYLERAEAVLRIVRCLCARSVDLDGRRGDGHDSLQRLVRLLVAWGAIPAERSEDPIGAIVAGAVGAEDDYGSALASARFAQGAASVIRERLSVDSWKLLGRLDAQLGRDIAGDSVSDALEALEGALTTLSALSGLAQENINRVAGWRFIEMGRRVERAINTCRFARSFAADNASADDLDILLDLIDSQITYRSRYLIGVGLAPIRDMVMLDPFNPRSAAFQIDQIRRHLMTLPTLNENGIPDEPRRMIDALSGEIAGASAREATPAMTLAVEQKLMKFADALGLRYFLQRPDRIPAKSLSGLA